MAMPEPVQGWNRLDDLPDVLTARQIAGVLQCSEKHVQDLARKDRIPHFKVGRLVRFPKAQFVRWINEG